MYEILRKYINEIKRFLRFVNWHHYFVKTTRRLFKLWKYQKHHAIQQSCQVVQEEIETGMWRIVVLLHSLPHYSHMNVASLSIDK